MRDNIDALDQLIDALNAGEEPLVDAAEDPELAWLLEAVQRIRRLEEPHWPDQEWVEDVMGQFVQQVPRRRVRSAPLDDGHAVSDQINPVLLQQSPATEPEPVRRSRRHEFGLMLVAGVVLVLFAGGLATLLQGRQGGAHPGQAGGVTAPLCRTPTRGYATQASNLSVAAAQQRVPFPLLLPQPLPASLSLAGIDLQGPGIDTPGAGPVNVVVRLCDGEDDNALVRVTESNGPVVTPNAQQMQDTFARSAHLDPTNLPVPSQETVTLGGRAMTKTVIHTSPTGGENVAYWWREANLQIQVSGSLDAQLSDTDIEAVVLGLIQAASTTTPTTSTGSPPAQPVLPLTVTAGGVPITLESATATSSVLTFRFMVQLPSWAAASSNTNVTSVIEPIRLDDIQVQGLDDLPAPQSAIEPHRAGQPVAFFTLTLFPAKQPHQTVTLTLLRLTLASTSPIPTTPSGLADVSGPWTFVVSSAMLTMSPTPSPSPSASRLPSYTGDFKGLTFTQARQRAPFPLVQPRWIPPALEEDGLLVAGDPTEMTVNGTPVSLRQHAQVMHAVTWTFGPADSSQQYGIQIAEQDGNQPRVPLTGATPTRLTTGGQQIMRCRLTNGTSLRYQWVWEGTRVTVNAQLAGPLHE